MNGYGCPLEAITNMRNRLEFLKWENPNLNSLLSFSSERNRLNVKTVMMMAVVIRISTSSVVHKIEIIIQTKLTFLSATVNESLFKFSTENKRLLPGFSSNLNEMVTFTYRITSLFTTWRYIAIQNCNPHTPANIKTQLSSNPGKNISSINFLILNPWNKFQLFWSSIETLDWRDELITVKFREK